MKKNHSFIKAVLALATIGWLSSAAFTSRAQTAPADLSPDLQQVVRLSQQHLSDDVVINYIRNSGKTYHLSADDIIYLNRQGVSQTVIGVLQTGASASPATSAPSAPPPPSDSSAPVPPALDTAPAAPSATPAFAPPPPAAGLQDNFFADRGLNPGVWQTDSGVLNALASMNGSQVFPALAFSPAGMQMSGTGGPGQFMGIQSIASFAPPFNFTATVSGQSQAAIPFEIYLVTADFQEWLSVAGHLGGRGEGSVGVGFGPFHARVAARGNGPDYGVWINHAGSGFPLSSLGKKFFENPIAGVPYTIQVSAGADGAASVTMLDSAGAVLASRNVPLGSGPFYVVLAGRNGPTFATWQSVQLTPALPPVVEAPPVPAAPTMDYFQSQLTPYGNWIEVPGYGLCWQPAVDFGWRPYYDQGHWEYSDDGWYWQSDYPWGDIAFHYGRWAYTATGWVWVPGFQYAPAWVLWRHADADGCIGWAPLPPGAVFVNGGWEFNHVRVGVDFNFGLSLNFFAFVGFDHFWEHDFRRFVLPHDRLAIVFGHSVIENHYRFDHGRFINDGLARDRMAALTHHEIRAVAVHDLREHEEHRNAIARRDDLHNFKPGAKPDARRLAPEHPGAPARNAAPENHNQPGKSQFNGGRSEDNSRSQSSRGNSQTGGKDEHGEPK